MTRAIAEDPSQLTADRSIADWSQSLAPTALKAALTLGFEQFTSPVRCASIQGQF